MPDVPLRRWEYRVVLFGSDDTSDGLENLNTAGADGWEAVGVMPKAVDESWVILKREVLDEPGPRGRVGFT